MVTKLNIMKAIFRNKVLLVLAVVLVISSCEDLDTENPNDPPISQVLSSGADLESFLAGGYLTWWQANHQSRPALTLGVHGDAVSCSWGNFGMRRFGNEPREIFNNSTTESQDYIDVVNFPYFRNLSAQFTANEVIKAISVNGVSTGNTDTDNMLLSGAFFLRGLARGYLGLLFDQAFITDENTDLTTLGDATPNTYQEMIASAVADMDVVIANAATQDFTFSAQFVNGEGGNQDWLARLASSYAARFLAQSPRTSTENAAVDWASVRDYALNGITENFAPQADGNVWFGYWRYATGTQGSTWARVDMRVMSAVASNYPARYPVDGSAPPAVPDTVDFRLRTDFEEMDNVFLEARGRWHFGTHMHERYDETDYMGDGISSGPMPVFVTTDNDMLLAEAYLRLNNLADAQSILNDPASRRKANGLLPDVALDAGEIENAILHERFVEILNTGPASQFFDRRRIGPRVTFTEMGSYDGLQEGSVGHFPIPAQELETLQLDIYTFGGPSDLGGIGQ